MPEHLRALVVIIAASVVGFYLVMPLARGHGLSSELRAWMKAWFFVTLAAFLAHDIWIFFALLAVYLVVAVPKNPPFRLSLYVLLVLALPNFITKVSGFGLVNYLAELSYARVLVVALLIPCLMVKYADGIRVARFGKIGTDKYVLIFVALCAVLDFRGVSFTEGLRQATYYIIDVLIPYYVFSRHLTTETDIRKVLIALLVPIFIMSIMAFPETLKGWHFYTSVPDALGLSSSGPTSYKYRSGLLRAYGPYGAINFGLQIALAFAGLLYLRQHAKAKYVNIIGFVLLGALVLTLSRGPWVSFLVMVIIYVLLGRESGKALSTILLIGAVSVPILFVTPFGGKILDVLPFVGSEAEQVNVTYRQRVIEDGIEVANENPIFGNPDFHKHPKMEALRQGEGIIDIVNTYIQYLLYYGYAGLAAFLMIFVSVIRGLWRVRTSLKKTPLKKEFDLANIFLVMWTASLVLIMTVSSLRHGITSISYWMLAGLSVAFSNYAASAIREHKESLKSELESEVYD